MLDEKISKHLNTPYVYLPNYKKYLCSNGVLFSLEEYKNGIDLQTEYDRRKNSNDLYDYAYAKSTGLLRAKRGTAKTKEVSEKREENVEESLQDTSKTAKTTVQVSTRETKIPIQRNSIINSVFFIIALLAVTSVISGYISTLQTATYLYDYVDLISAWLMSASVTAYNTTAFEVAVIFKQNKRYGLTFVFISLWVMVTLFSMATAVSVFYDRFNFNEAQITQSNKAVDANKLSLDLLRTKEKDLREAIAFKKKDIEYRQEREYATTAVRNELTKLEAELQDNLSQQQKLLSETPEVSGEKAHKKESLFAFLGRIMHIEGGILEFSMSTLSAIFVNIISPLSVTAVIELRKRDLTKAN